MMFYEMPNGLYCYYLDMVKTKDSVSAFSFLNTVEKLKIVHTLGTNIK